MISPMQKPPLTPRQLQAVKGLCQGLSHKMVAESIGCAYKTAQNHIKDAKTRLGVNNSTALVSWYWSKRVEELETRLAQLEGKQIK